MPPSSMTTAITISTTPQIQLPQPMRPPNPIARNIRPSITPPIRRPLSAGTSRRSSAEASRRAPAPAKNAAHPSSSHIRGPAPLVLQYEYHASPRKDHCPGCDVERVAPPTSPPSSSPSFLFFLLLFLCLLLAMFFRHDSPFQQRPIPQQFPYLVTFFKGIRTIATARPESYSTYVDNPSNCEPTIYHIVSLEINPV